MRNTTRDTTAQPRLHSARAWQRRLLTLSAAALLVPASALADEAEPTAREAVEDEQVTQPAEERQPATRQPERAMLDVEELNDEPYRYAGQTVSVAGEIEDLRGGHTFVLESGGLLDDEITVIVPPSVRATVRGLAPDADLIVTGKVRGMRIIEVEREIGLDMDPQLEAELEGVEYFLVAERIERQPAR